MTHRSASYRWILPLAVAVLLIAYGNLINLLPQHLHDRIYVPLNLTVLALLLAWMRWKGFSWSELGFSTERKGASAFWGVGLGLAIPAPMFIALVLPESISSLIDLRDFSGVSAGELAYRTLMRIPFGTALFEEAAFRGVLFAVWLNMGGLRNAIVGSSVAFGFWHIAPTYELMSGAGIFPNTVLLWLAIIGGCGITVVGGLFFAWMRLRTGAIWAPALTHWLINALAAVAAFLVSR